MRKSQMAARIEVCEKIAGTHNLFFHVIPRNVNTFLPSVYQLLKTTDFRLFGPS